MPRVDGVVETALYVADLERATSFYTSLFGFSVVARGERLVALAVAPRQLLLLFRSGASVGLARGAHDGSGRLHMAFAIPAAELEVWDTWLAEKGVAVEERRTWELGGRSLYFRDPDGHLLEVATPGTWSVY
jgi:catechol 2,3-dioxygenase-like lactoylglutathione lyase family enzyme